MEPNNNQTPQPQQPGNGQWPAPTPVPGAGALPQPPVPQQPQQSAPSQAPPAPQPYQQPAMPASGAATPPPAAAGARPSLQPIPPQPYSTPNQGSQQSVPSAPAPGGSNGSSKKKKLLAIIAGAVALLLIAGGLAYFFLMRDKSDRDVVNDAVSESQNSAEGAKPLKDLQKVNMTAPNDMKGYKVNDLGVPTVKDFVTDDGKCELQFGTLSAAQLPGEDVGDIVSKQLDAYRKNGASVEGPDPGEALVLKDTKSNTTYSLPTMVFSFSKGDSYVLSHYSAVVLKSGDRAYVTRVCQNKGGRVSADALNPVNQMASKITVSVEQ